MPGDPGRKRADFSDSGGAPIAPAGWPDGGPRRCEGNEGRCRCAPPVRGRQQLCFGCPSAASLATISWRFNLSVASVRLSRSHAKWRLGNRRRDRGAECCLASNPPERLDHAQPPAASLKLNHAIGVGPGLGQSFRRRRPPHRAERRVPIRGVTSGSPAPFTLRHGAKQLTQFTTARPASPVDA